MENIAALLRLMFKLKDNSVLVASANQLMIFLKYIVYSNKILSTFKAIDSKKAASNKIDLHFAIILW